MAALHSCGGLGGVVVLSLLILGGTSVFVYRNTVNACQCRLVAISLTGLAMSASTIHWLARPHLATPLFAAMFCWVLNTTEMRVNAERLLLLLLANLVERILRQCKADKNGLQFSDRH